MDRRRPTAKSYQSTFSSRQACEAARDVIYAEGQRLKAEAENRIVNNAPNGALRRLELMQLTPPTVTAVSVFQKQAESCWH
jgi:hypothetical protein